MSAVKASEVRKEVELEKVVIHVDQLAIACPVNQQRQQHYHKTAKYSINFGLNCETIQI